MRIGILIPSRDRPDLLRRAIQSVRDTSFAADCLVYVDDDQGELYERLEQEESQRSDARAIFHHGSQVGPVASANEMVKVNPGYEVYGFLTDDMVVESPGWDEWVLEESKQWICCSPTQNLGDKVYDHVDIPYVHRRWIDRFGWYAYPGCYHTGWPTITGVLAEAAGCLIKAPKGRFHVRHNEQPSQNQERLREDARQLYAFFQSRFSQALRVLR